MDSKPFRSVRYNIYHVLYLLLPFEKDIHYNLRQQLFPYSSLSRQQFDQEEFSAWDAI